MTEEDRFLAFAEFHQANPEVWDLFQRFTFEAMHAGMKVGARLIVERIRWERIIVLRRTEKTFKINDHHWPYYARLFCSTFPQHEGFFELRQRKNARVV
jgi:hypothetical protein